MTCLLHSPPLLSSPVYRTWVLQDCVACSRLLNSIIEPRLLPWAIFQYIPTHLYRPCGATCLRDVAYLPLSPTRAVTFAYRQVACTDTTLGPAAHRGCYIAHLCHTTYGLPPTLLPFYTVCYRPRLLVDVWRPAITSCAPL